MSKLALWTFLFPFLLLLDNALACEVSNLTGKTMEAQRKSLYTSSNMPGVRVGITGMKDANSKYGLGKVNDSLAAYEKSLCRSFEKTGAPKVKIYKTDFKGYYITCSPMPGCMEKMERAVNQVPGPQLSKTDKLGASSVKSANYSEGYIKARTASEYPNYKGPLEDFIQKELKEATMEATGSKALNKINPDDPKFLERLSKNVELYRKSGEGAVEKDFRRLVKGLDNLLEVPFSNSNNIEAELGEALSGNKAAQAAQYKVSAAQTGDDLFIVVKEGDEVVKVVGADARGLGVANMTSRYKELALAYKKGKGPKKIEDVLDLSKKAIKRADESMEKSLGLYKKLALEELSRPDLGGGVDEAIKRAHDKYHALSLKDPELMGVRAGAINNCGTDKSQIMNRITGIHNRLKLMEAAGLDGIFGASCLGAEYLILRHGLGK